MRALPVIAALLFAVPAFADDGGAAGSEEKLPPLKVTVDRDKVDLDAHRLELSMSREAKSVKIRVLAEDGSELAEQEHDFSGKPAGATLVVTWQPKSDDAVARIEPASLDQMLHPALDPKAGPVKGPEAKKIIRKGVRVDAPT